MINISEKDRNFIIDNIEDGEKKLNDAIKNSDFEELLGDLDLYIVNEGMTEEGELLANGRKMEIIHDNIIYELDKNF